jgi:RNA polymerase sigma-70 factor
MAVNVDEDLVSALYARGGGARWSLSLASFTALVTLSVGRAFAGQTPDRSRVKGYLASLHAEDLALACACADGSETAWDHFVREYRPVLYRAADAIDPAGGAREIADSLYGELFGLGLRDGERHSHFRFFHGRSSLATWLRAVLSQRYVDRVRVASRLTPLPADEAPDALVAADAGRESAHTHYLALMQRVVATVVAALTARERLRLRLYYAQDLTLAQIGKLLGEHEATVSRQLARTRRAIRQQVELVLREQERLTEAEIGDCFAAVLEDSGPLDLSQLLAPESERKELAQDRSE